MTNAPPPAANPESADPSMEEILASIRRILNDDEVPASATTEPPDVAEKPKPEDDDVLILDETMMVAGSKAPVAVSEAERPAEADHAGPMRDEPGYSERMTPDPVLPDPVVSQPEWEPPHQEAEVRPALAADTMGPPAPDLLGPEAAAAAATSVGSLLRTLAAGRATQVYGGGPTLEDLVRAELRPLLKEWLDTHLPPMVERLVRAEIERVVGRCVP